MVSLTSVETPLTLLKNGKSTIFVKDETRQVGGSFKFRGPEHFFTKNPRVSSVVTASSGNHAIGVANAATGTGRKAHVFIPNDTPHIKRKKISEAGAIIHLVHGSYEDALLAAKEFAQASDITFLPSYDHPMIIQGNRKIFQEAVAQAGICFDRVAVPVGGGGCISAAIEEFAGTGTQIMAAEYAPFSRVDMIALKDLCSEISSTHIAEPSTEGIAIKTLGVSNKRILADCENLSLHGLSLAELEDACRLLFTELGIVAELGGCAGVAAALNAYNTGGPTLCIVTGGNIAPEFHAQVLDGCKVL